MTAVRAGASAISVSIRYVADCIRPDKSLIVDQFADKFKQNRSRAPNAAD